jgi:cytochrome b561/polyisoprenoid-binding protein YceI
MKAPRSRYSTVAIILHWTIAAAILFQMSLGWRMEDAKGPTGFAIFQLHKSIGITILLLSLARLIWRIIHPALPPLADQPRWEQLASKTVHTAFYVIMIGLPITGWLLVSTSRIEVPTLLFGTVPWPNVPGLHDLAPGAKGIWHEASEFGHHALVYLTLALLVLHLGAVAKHQFLDRDEVFARMAPGARPGWSEGRIWLVALLALTALVAAKLYTPSTQAAAKAPTLSEPAEAPAVPAAVPPPPAAEVAPPEANVVEAAEAPAAPSAWAVQPGSALGFTASWSGQPIEGRFTKWDADIFFSPDALDQSRLRVTIDIASASTGDAQRDASLPSSDWFDAAAHPKALFTARDFRKISGRRYEARGTLDLRGVTKPVTLRFSLGITGDIAKVKGEATIDRTRFGVGQGSWATTDQIAAPVKIDFALTAKRK